MNKTIIDVVNDKLCIGCGTCVSICPINEIELTIDKKKGVYAPKINADKCMRCGLCYKVCPGHEVDFDMLNMELFNKLPEQVLMGNYISCYMGHAIDHQIRCNSSSGGVITELLIFALEIGLIDGALVTRMKRDNPLEPESFIARTKEEIIEAAKSKYCPVPTNKSLKEILDSSDGEKFATVGLACHIQGIRKAQMVNKTLSEKIILCFEIFCSHTDNFFATEFILKWKGIDKKDVIRLDYRGNGWPGFMSVELKNGHIEKIPYIEYITVHELYMFSPRHCKSCYDGIGELSDISIGDAWGIMQNDAIGTSLCISRTDCGEKILREAMANRRLELKKLAEIDVLNSQGLLSINKIRRSRAMSSLSSMFMQQCPQYIKKDIDSKKYAPKYIDYIILIFLDAHRIIASRKIFWTYIAKILPLEKKIVQKIFGQK